MGGMPETRLEKNKIFHLDIIFPINNIQSVGLY
jgi:hypothetical protein